MKEETARIWTPRLGLELPDVLLPDIRESLKWEENPHYLVSVEKVFRVGGPRHARNTAAIVIHYCGSKMLRR